MGAAFKVSIAGGIDAVTDAAYGDGKHVAYMENLDVRGGNATPIMQPLYNPTLVVPAGSVQVFSYRGRVIFSSSRRSYAAEFQDSRERIYWAQYGGNPMKMIEGTVVPLGTKSPLIPPGVQTGTYVSPQSITAVVTTGGTLSQYSNVTFRLAYQTAFGILPPSGIIQPTISIANAQVTLTWSNPILDTPATAILLFMGVVGGDEKYLATLGAKQTSFIYNSLQTAFGDLASNYDQQDFYTYCMTYLRNVNGVQDESGPSEPSPSVKALNSRNININPWADGTMNSPNLVTWSMPFQFVDINSLPGNTTNPVTGVSGSPLTVSSIALESGTNKVLCTFTTNHYFCNNEKIFISGCVPDPFTVISVDGQFVVGQTYKIVSVGTTNFIHLGAASNTVGLSFVATYAGTNAYNGSTNGNGTASQELPVQISVPSPTISNLAPVSQPESCYLSVPAGFNTYTAGSFTIGKTYTILSLGTTNWTAIGAAAALVGTTFVATGVGSGSGTAFLTLTGSITAYRVPQVYISAMKYNPESGVIDVITATPHSFNDENVLFTGFADTGWENQQIPVLADPFNANRFFVQGMAMPSDTTFGTQVASRALTAIELTTGGAGASLNLISATALTTGCQYAIASVGTTSFTAIGSTANTVGTTFIYNGVTATGTGTVVQVPLVGDVVYVYLTTSATSSTTIPAANMAVGTTYTITVVGTTNWALCGLSSSAIVGATFVCSQAGTGTGEVSGAVISIQEAYTVVATPPNAFLVAANIPGAMNATYAPTYTSGISHIPFNDYITKRRIYRAGGTTSFQLCKEASLDLLEFQDALPDQALGDVLPTLFSYNGVNVVVQPAPYGITGLTIHNSIAFAWDPDSNRVVWTLSNQYDAWVPDFYKSFQYRILALAEQGLSLAIFCEDGVYRCDGGDPTNLVWNKTDAMPCRAGGSVQKINNRLIYLGDEGLLSFDGHNSVTLTDIRIPGQFWVGNSGYLGSTDPGQYLVPAFQNAAFQRLKAVDIPNTTPRDLIPYMVDYTNITQGIRSFVKYGKYYLYWGGDYPQYAAQTMICIDFASPGSPLSVIGVKAMDAFVDEVERVHMILTYPVQ